MTLLNRLVFCLLLRFILNFLLRFILFFLLRFILNFLLRFILNFLLRFILFFLLRFILFFLLRFILFFPLRFILLFILRFILFFFLRFIFFLLLGFVLLLFKCRLFTRFILGRNRACWCDLGWNCRNKAKLQLAHGLLRFSIDRRKCFCVYFGSALTEFKNWSKHGKMLPFPPIDWKAELILFGFGSQNFCFTYRTSHFFDSSSFYRILSVIILVANCH